MFRGLVELFWPQVCPICDVEATHGPRVHGQCLDRISRARPAPEVVACFEDGPLWFRLLHQWKYGGERGLADVVAASMVARAPSFEVDAVLVPVPDDPERRMQRGFSPVADLARSLAGRTGMRLDARLIHRARSSPSQTSCVDDRSRRDNIRGVFRAGDLSRWGPDRTLVLVEDQVTSGATIFEAVSILGLRGAPVRVWCAARAARAPRQLDAPQGRH